jgi:K+-sensing histidine kinase KdpD
MEKTLIEIPTELLESARMTADEARTELAIRLYQLHRLNEAQARELAGDPGAIESLIWNREQTGQIDLDQFVSWASHDLKSPLNSIIGFTRLVIKGMDGPINETQTTDLNTAFNGAQRMLILISNLVDIARLNRGQIKLTLKENNIEFLLNETADKWKLQHPAKPLSVKVRAANPNFTVDNIYLKQVVNSLLTYAAIRVTEGSLSLIAEDNETGLRVNIQSAGKKSPDKSELDSAMYDFVCGSLIKLHGGTMDTPQETEDGLLLAFSLPRK